MAETEINNLFILQVARRLVVTEAELERAEERADTAESCVSYQQLSWFNFVYISPIVIVLWSFGHLNIVSNWPSHFVLIGIFRKAVSLTGYMKFLAAAN